MKARTHWWWRFLAWCSEADRYPHVPWGKNLGRDTPSLWDQR